jgi:hypothetical protein
MEQSKKLARMQLLVINANQKIHHFATFFDKITSESKGKKTILRRMTDDVRTTLSSSSVARPSLLPLTNENLVTSRVDNGGRVGIRQSALENIAKGKR